MTIQLEAFGASHIGRRRNNEDAYCLHPSLGLFAVADGMGGYEGGEIASRLALTTIAEFFHRNAEDGDLTWPFAFNRRRSLTENLVEISVRLAHSAIVSHRSAHARLSKMGTTVAMAVLDPSSTCPCLVIGHVGDSRVYRLRRGRLEQLTCDHSLYEQLKATGMQMPPIEECHFSNVITQALGTEKDAHADLSVHEVREGDRYLLCTDGLSGPLPLEELELLCGHVDPQKACDGLIDAAYEAGGKDNITALIVEVRELRPGERQLG